MASISIDLPKNIQITFTSDEKREKAATSPSVLTPIDPLVKAIYDIPAPLFIPEAARVLNHFHGVASELLFNLRQTEGSMPALKEDFPNAELRFASLMPQTKIVIERLRGEEVDAGAKISLNGAIKALTRFDNARQAGDLIGTDALRECQIGIDMLKVGLSMMQMY